MTPFEQYVKELNRIAQSEATAGATVYAWFSAHQDYVSAEVREAYEEKSNG